VREKAEQEINKYVGDLDSYLKQLVQQGKITQDDYSTIMNYVNSIVESAKEGMAEMEKMVEKAFKEGYDKAKNEMVPIAIIAGVGGFALGHMFGPVVVEAVRERLVPTAVGG